MKRQISCSLVVVIALSLIIAFAPAIGKAEAAQPTVALNDYLLSVEKAGIDTVYPFGGGKNLMFSQSGTYTVDTGSNNNLETTVTFKNPIYLADNGTDTPFVSFSLFSHNQSSRDIDAIIFTLIDVNDPDNHISVMLGVWDDGNGNKGIMYAKGSGQKFVGYHNNGSGNMGWNYPDSQGTLLGRSGIGKNLMETLGFYYDYATQKIYCNMYWSNYASRNQVFDGKVLIRDLSQALEGYEAAYTKGIEKAYLKITTVKGWYAYADEYGETSAFNYTSGKHTAMGDLSTSGAQYLIRTIDGQNMKTEADGVTMTDNGVLGGYFATNEKATEAGKKSIPALKGCSVLRGAVEAPDYTSALYLKADKGTLGGTADGKWTKDATVELKENGTYTIGYYSDEACTSKVAEYTVTLESKKEIDYDNLVFGSDSSALFTAAESSERTSFATGDSAKQSGVVVGAKTGAHVTYGKNIKLDKLTKETALVEFMPVIAKTGSYDFRRVHFKFSDAVDPTKYFTVDFHYDGTWSGSPATVVFAYGDNQNPYGLKYIRALNEFDCGVSSQTLSGKNTKGTYGTFGLYYDSVENCIYMSPTYSWAAGGVPIGKAKLRDFDDDEIATGNGGANKKDEAKWTGFTGEEIVMEFWMDYYETSVTVAKLGITSVGGELLGNKLSADMPAEGVVGFDYEIPEPEYFNYISGKFENFSDAEVAEFKVFDANGAEVEVVDGKFNPQTSGEYKILYAVLEGNTSYGYYASVNVYGEDGAPTIVFDSSESEIMDGMSLYAGNSVTVKISASSEIMLTSDKSLAVSGKMIVNGSEVKDLTGNDKIDCMLIGSYELVFVAKDYVGRTAEKRITFDVTRTSVSFVNAGDENITVDITDGKLSASASDVAVEDVYYADGVESRIPSKDFAWFETNIKVRSADGEWQDYTADYEISAVGKYEIGYFIGYRTEADGEIYSAKKIKTVTAVDNKAPQFEGDTAVAGATIEEKTDSLDKYKAIVGAKVSFPYLKATDVIGGKKIELNNVKATLTGADGNSSDITNLFVDGKYEITLTEAGTYYLTFEVSDGTWTVKKIFSVETRNYWLEIAVDETLGEAEFGTEYSFPVATIKDLNGNAVSGAEITITIYKTETQAVNAVGNKWTPDVAGEFKVVWTAIISGETASCERTLVVKDKTVPTISFAEEPKTSGFVGETYVLPAITVNDNADSGLEYQIYVTFGGERRLLEDSSFIPEEAGEYLIEIVCSDTSGNVGREEVRVTVKAAEVKDNGCRSDISTSLPALLVVLAFAVVMSIKNKKEQNQ